MNIDDLRQKVIELRTALKGCMVSELDAISHHLDFHERRLYVDEFKKHIEHGLAQIDPQITTTVHYPNPSREDSSIMLVVDDKFTAVWSSHIEGGSQLEELKKYLEFLISVYPKQTTVEKTPEPTVQEPVVIDVVEDQNFAVTRPEITPTMTVVSEPEVIGKTPVAIVTEDYTDEEFRRKSVEKMAAARDEVSALNHEANEAKENARFEIFNRYLVAWNLPSRSITAVLRKRLSLIREPIQTASDFIKSIIDENPSYASIENQVRLLLEVFTINERNKMRFSNWFLPDNTSDVGRIDSFSKKEEMFILTLSNLDIVEKQRRLRSSELPDLKMYMYLLDYCDRGSSLHIATTPEEIARLAASAYDIFSVNSFSKDFIYAPDVNNPYEINNLDWFKKCSVYQSLYGLAKKALSEELTSGNDAVLTRIDKLLGTRDSTMSLPHLNSEAVKQIFGLVDDAQLWSDWDTEGFNVVSYDSESTLVLKGVYKDHNKGNLIDYVIICTDELVVNLTSVRGNVAQSFYTHASAPVCIKFLMYTLDNLGIDY